MVTVLFYFVAFIKLLYISGCITLQFSTLVVSTINEHKG